MKEKKKKKKNVLRYKTCPFFYCFVSSYILILPPLFELNYINLYIRLSIYIHKWLCTFFFLRDLLSILIYTVSTEKNYSILPFYESLCACVCVCVCAYLCVCVCLITQINVSFFNIVKVYFTSIIHSFN